MPSTFPTKRDLTNVQHVVPACIRKRSLEDEGDYRQLLSASQFMDAENTDPNNKPLKTSACQPQYIAVLFYATWCQASQSLYDDLPALFEEFESAQTKEKDRFIVFRTVAVDEIKRLMNSEDLRIVPTLYVWKKKEARTSSGSEEAGGMAAYEFKDEICGASIEAMRQLLVTLKTP
eukprot:Clim_evm7s201 gene=Clim_evmTU7s201